jgi:hypothetical protein
MKVIVGRFGVWPKRNFSFFLSRSTIMCRKLIILTSFILVLALAGTNVVFGSIVIERRVDKSANDSEEKDPAGDAEGLDSTDLEFPYEDEGTPPSDPMIVGIRFEDIDIPKGSSISEAWIEFECDEIKNGTDFVSLIIEGELNPDARIFVGSDSDIIPRPRTTAQVVWVPVAWTEVSQKDQTSNIAPVIEEIVNQDGWKSGNALVLIISDDPANPSKGIRCAEAYDGEAANAPLLHIEFTSKSAIQPDPPDGGLYEDTWVTLAWTAGDTATSHDVYLGENYEDVLNGTGETFRGNQATTFYIAGFPGYPYPDGLVPGTTYYWRVDEVEADGTTKYQGQVWSFTVPSKIAYDPDPLDGAKFIDPDVTLSWTAGFGAKLHTVYFGDNFDDVSNATGGIPEGITTYAPGTLEMDKTYYWRVDEFDGMATNTGDVWNFKTLPVITITDPNLIGWWKFDEGSGSTALDWSGYGNDGRLGGDPQWVEGIMGGALDLDGNDYVSIDGVVDDITGNNITLSAWIKTTQGGEGNVFASNDSASGHVLLFGIDNGNAYVDDGPSTDWPPAVNDDQWHMLTYVLNRSKEYIYVDGVQVGTLTASIDITTETRWSIGQEWDDSDPSNFYSGLVDDARFYNASLTAEQVKELMRGDPLVAWNPRPNNNSTVDIDEAKQPLSWSAGDEAAQHDIYFGLDESDVANADASDTTGIYRGRQGTTSYSIPEALEWASGPYYWRIDEYNTDGTISTGGIWSFSVADYLIVDDFEDYDVGNNEIWWVWIDGLGYPVHPTLPPHPGNGTGSMVGDETTLSYMEETIVHGGFQSMPIYYDNNQQGKLKYSEVEKTLSSVRDWTREGVGVLTIWFRGNAANAAETLYVALNGNAIVNNDDPAAAQVETWTQWNIDLQLFADQGVNLANVNTIAIGLGNKNNPLAGGSGTIYIDDIRLYRPAP